MIEIAPVASTDVDNRSSRRFCAANSLDTDRCNSELFRRAGRDNQILCGRRPQPAIIVCPRAPCYFEHLDLGRAKLGIFIKRALQVALVVWSCRNHARPMLVAARTHCFPANLRSATGPQQRILISGGARRTIFSHCRCRHNHCVD